MNRKLLMVLGVAGGLIGVAIAQTISEDTDNITEVASDAKDEVRQKVEVVIYGTKHCRYCTLAKQLLDRKGIEYTEKDAWNEEVREEMREMTGVGNSVPQILIGEKHIGGYVQLRDLSESGKLEEMIAGKE